MDETEGSAGVTRLVGLAATRQAEGRLDEAIALYSEAIGLKPTDPVIRYNLGTALFARGDLDGATRVLQEALAHSVEEASLHYGLGCVHQAAGRPGPALDCFWRATRLRGDDPDAWYGLGSVQHALGSFDAARQSFQRVVELEPDHAAATHLLGALEGRPMPRPPEVFVRDLFDSYADRFDDHLREGLDYRAPELVHEALCAALATDRTPRVLDLGCGTGLFGERIRAQASEIIGVDVSPRMLAKARERGGYAELHAQELGRFLSDAEAETFDVVAAVDVFGYLGQLEQVFASVHRILRRNGLFAFTVEAGEAELQLATTGRYRHSLAYVERISRGTGFAVSSIRSVALRSERGQPCAGTVVVLRG